MAPYEVYDKRTGEYIGKVDEKPINPPKNLSYKYIEKTNSSRLENIDTGACGPCLDCDDILNGLR